MVCVCVCLPERLRAYFRGLREAVVQRLLPHIFNADDSPNKFWLAFAKRSFMSKEM